MSKHGLTVGQMLMYKDCGSLEVRKCGNARKSWQFVRALATHSWHRARYDPMLPLRSNLDNAIIHLTT